MVSNPPTLRLSGNYSFTPFDGSLDSDSGAVGSLLRNGMVPEQKFLLPLGDQRSEKLEVDPYLEFSDDLEDLGLDDSTKRRFRAGYESTPKGFLDFVVENLITGGDLD